MKKHCGQKIRDKSCQSNFDTRASDFGSFLVIVFVSKYIGILDLLRVGQY